MSNDRSHLVPVQRTDINGVTRTRWVKPDGPAAKQGRTIPAPANAGPSRKVVTKEFIADLSKAINDRADMFRLMRWCDSRDTEEQEAFRSALGLLRRQSFDRRIRREQMIIAVALSEFMRGDDTADEVVGETLRLRSVFCSDWAVENDAPVADEIAGHIYGMRALSKNGKLPLERPQAVLGLSACLRFAYELRCRFPDEEFLPTDVRTFTTGRGFGLRKNSYAYKDVDTANYVYRNHEQVDRLIEIAAQYRTTEMTALRGLLENGDGAASLSRGWL